MIKLDDELAPVGVPSKKATTMSKWARKILSIGNLIDVDKLVPIGAPVIKVMMTSEHEKKPGGAKKNHLDDAVTDKQVHQTLGGHISQSDMKRERTLINSSARAGLLMTAMNAKTLKNGLDLVTKREMREFIKDSAMHPRSTSDRTANELIQLRAYLRKKGIEA